MENENPVNAKKELSKAKKMTAFNNKITARGKDVIIRSREDEKIITLPPKTSLASNKIGLWPASARYLAVERPANPTNIDQYTKVLYHNKN